MSPRRSYADAWHAGYESWFFTLRPFWRGKKYLKAWDNGRRRARIHTGLLRMFA